jgi:hypoxanthine phosphoribosyltransferase
VDSGLTLSYIRRMLLARLPRSLKICALLDKRERREVDITIDYVGFVIPNKFVIGYGLDLAQKYRNLPYVATLDESEIGVP